MTWSLAENDSRSFNKIISQKKVDVASISDELLDPVSILAEKTTHKIVSFTCPKVPISLKRLYCNVTAF